MTDEREGLTATIACAVCSEVQVRSNGQWVGDHACVPLAGDTIEDAEGQAYVCACDAENGYVPTLGWPAAVERVARFRVVERVSGINRLDTLRRVAQSASTFREQGMRQIDAIMSAPAPNPISLETEEAPPETDGEILALRAEVERLQRELDAATADSREGTRRLTVLSRLRAALMELEFKDYALGDRALMATKTLKRALGRDGES